MADLIQYEKNLYSKGYRLIAGIDEVGRGPLAGPFVVGAVILDLEKVFDALHREHTNNDVASRKVLGYKDINDSKKVSGKKRSILSEFITKEAIAYSIIEISPEQIDKDGLSKVTQIAFYNAVKKLKIKPDFVLTDAFEIKKLTKESQLNIINGDAASITIGAASIIAKVYRDAIMVEMHKKYPHYGFDKHKGYGTKEHILAIQKWGICEIHRKSFAPIKLAK
jgi:ribonuclease HII